MSAKCSHVLDDSTVPGWAIACVVCGRLWRRGPDVGRRGVSPRARLRVIAGRLLVLEQQRAALVAERDAIVQELLEDGASLRSVAADAGVSHVQLIRRARLHP